MVSSPDSSVPGGRHPRMTPEQFGEALYNIALGRMRNHHAELVPLGAAPSPSKEYLIGLTTFVLAPLEQVLSDVPMPQLRAAKRGLRSALMRQFKVRDTSQFEPVLNGQMSAYAQMARAGDLLTLGTRAAESIGLDGNVDVETFLVKSYTSSLNFWLDQLAVFGVETSSADPLGTSSPPAPKPPASPSSRSLLIRAVQGEIPLAAAFWGWGVGGNLALTVLLTAIAVDHPTSFKPFSIVYLVYFAFSVVVTWQSSEKYKGDRIWAILARVAVMIQIGRIVLGYYVQSRFQF